MNQFYNDLKELILNGDNDLAVEKTKVQLDAGMNPVAFVQEYLEPILNDIGEQFSRLEIFLPELILSADVAKDLKDVVRNALLKNQGEENKQGKIVIGTAHGDVHDIGKNIVATLLEVNGFEIVDLGNDVSPDRFIETAQKENADIIALSSLLTTSMPFMVDVIRALEGYHIRDRFKVIVGGGPVSQEWADSIGADGYSSDANGAVDLCRRLLA
jgi:corrinoid protein of di/trimethylamine methyltransferase